MRGRCVGPCRARARGRRHADRHHRNRDRFVSRCPPDCGGARGRPCGARDRSASGCDAGGSPDRRTPRAARPPQGDRRRRDRSRHRASPCNACRAAPAAGRAPRARGAARASDRDSQPRGGCGDGGRTRGVPWDGGAPLLLVGRAGSRSRRARVLRLVRRKRHVPERCRAAIGCNHDRARPHPGRDGQPIPRAAAAPWTTERPANVVHTLHVVAEARGESFDDLAAATDSNATAAFALP